MTTTADTGWPSGGVPPNRREFLKGAAVLGVSGGALQALAGCGGGESEEAQKGGQLRMGMVDFLSTDPLDPAAMFSSFGFLVGSNVFEPLTAVDANLNPKPGVAEEFEEADGARVWTFRLRPDVEFHSGKTITSADVVYSYQRQFEKATAAAFVGVIAPFVDPKQIIAVDKRTVRFELKKAHAFFPAIAAFPAFAIVEEGEKEFKKPAGTGPFAVARYDMGERAEFVANKNYWVTDRPLLDRVVVTRIPDPNTKLEAVISGNMDLVDAVEYNQLPAVDQASGVERVPIEKAMFIPVSCDRKQEPFKDVRVRQAVKMAVDRDRWVNAVLGGAGVPSADVPVPPGDPFYPDSVDVWPHDPAGAKELLANAGYSNGLDLTIDTAPTGPGEVDAAVVLKEMLGEAGFRVNVRNQTVESFYAKAFLIKPCVVGWLLRGHASYISRFVYTSDAPIPQSNFANSDFDRLVGEAISSTDPATQKDRFQEAFTVMNDQAGEVIPAHGSKIFVRSKSVQNVKLDYMKIVDLSQTSVA